MSGAKGKSAIVTGAGSGIGLAVSRLLAEQGWRVALVDVNEIPPESMPPSREGGEHLSIRANVADESDVDEAVTRAVDEFGGLDALINSAAVTSADDVGILDSSVKTFDRVIAVNLRGTFLMCRRAMPSLVDTAGAVVNVSSAAAVMGLSSTAYPASKGGVNALTRAIAHQVAESGVRCTSVMPGMVDTPMLAVAAGKEGSSVRTTPGVFDRRAHPDEIAHLIAFLVSDNARFITGGAIAADGGLTKY
ncbi:SDR family NAD(P)-dependent oxidoreductase [Gordonia sp. KTR9]|uniref:SDR family NAD(P)-dependent oxidoreductase n=1 Tax=Gordonia sp. KTR9 TaxID=337191 RepID=UPI00027DD95D|nr:SDR family oxidoreductase [Gordonia sp. KTR9]AFR46887.1 short-chain dehydorgenase/reductase [Gordonia sp. KTR9]